MTKTNLALSSLITADCRLKISLADTGMPEPGDEEIVVRMEAAPINPSDLAILFGIANNAAVTQTGSADQPAIEAEFPAKLKKAVAGRLDTPIVVGNEGAGTVVAAGSSPEAQDLLGRTVSVFGGGTWRQHHCVNIRQCLALPQGVTAKEGASAFINPMTALAMVETMKAEGHSALVHTAAASNLGQMLNRICIDDGIPLVNIVRRQEQENVLRDLGAKYVVNSASADFLATLTEALAETGATLAFDAIGGGRLASDILGCMEAAALRKQREYSVYGSDVYKQVYIYGGLDYSPTPLQRNAGFKWGVGGFLLTHALQKLGPETNRSMRARVASEIKTTFASHYSHEISLREVLLPENVEGYRKMATGEKYLIRPQQ